MGVMYLKKNKIKMIKYFIIALVILIPIIKILLESQFGITLISTQEVIGTYFLIYSLLTMIAVLMVGKVSFGIVMFIFLCIYTFSLSLSNGLDSSLNTINEFNSPNNENILVVDARITWYPSGYMRFYKKINPFLKKLIRTPKLKWSTESQRISHAIEWKDDNTVIIAGPVVECNLKRLTQTKEKLPDKCDYEIIDKKLYLNLK